MRCRPSQEPWRALSPPCWTATARQGGMLRPRAIGAPRLPACAAGPYTLRLVDRAPPWRTRSPLRHLRPRVTAFGTCNKGAGRETHVSAQQPSSQAQARVSQSHAHARGSTHRENPSPSWSRSAVGLTLTPPDLLAAERLQSTRDVAATLRAARVSGRQLVLHHRDRADEGAPRLTVVASRRVGTAVQRNRAKRLLREAARAVPWPAGVDIVLVARPGVSDLAAVGLDLAELRERAGWQ